MTPSIGITSKHRSSAKLGAAIAISALLALGTFAAPASADWSGEHGGYDHNWNGGYYHHAPPVVYGFPAIYGGSYYGSPYYAPPVVYGPGVGIGLPGVSIGIR